MGLRVGLRKNRVHTLRRKSTLGDLGVLAGLKAKMKNDEADAADATSSTEEPKGE